MEVMAETPPLLPPKTKKSMAPNLCPENTPTIGTSISIAHPTGSFSPPRLSEEGVDRLSPSVESSASVPGPRIITWGSTRSESLYENVSGGVNYLENRLKSIASKNEVQAKSGGKRKTPKIEVRQEENKTVVKISIKDTPTPEEEMNGEDRFGQAGGIYQNGRQGPNGFVLYGEGEVGEEALDRSYENLSSGYYENVDSGERLYANVSEKEPTTEANYSNLNGDDSKCDQVYSNREILVSKSNVVSIIGKNPSPPVTGTFKRDDGDEELYENVETGCHVYSNLTLNGQKPEEKRDPAKKSSVVEVFLQKNVPMGKPEAEFPDDNSSGDPFDSGTCSDVDSLPNCAQNKKGNVIVTIKSLDKGEDKKTESGHKRAESLTSSGLGVDSEESDDEKSNISCDSLNSNEQQSNSEDHGYHTPNSEDKTGSPIDRIGYANVMEGASDDKNDIIRQVAGVSQKIRNLRMENGGLFAAKLVDASELEDYENVCVFPKFYKKKAPPPPPPVKQDSRAPAEDDEMKALPKSLLRDIRSRNVRLSSTYPSGEKPEGPVASAAFGLEGGAPRKAPPNDKHLMVEERTYEERKSDAGSAKTNKICAIEVDTDKFYKFHLAENARDGSKDEGGAEEETFAGVKDYLCREKPAAITSAKGTIRGVKNRVKAGIATFLQMHENKSYKDRDAGKVVVYTTTMGIVRETYHKCLKVKQILRTLMVKFEERDVFMSSEAQDEIRDRMKCSAILVPQVFVEGQHIGDAETIERLNEVGELRTILRPYKSADACSTCKVCGGYRLLPCSICKGSKKSIHRNHFTAEFVALKCMNCDQVGLTKCYAC